MPVAPTYLIKQNQPDSHQTNPAWTVLFVRFSEPASMFNRDTPNPYDPQQPNLMGTRPIMSSIVTNDCIGAAISNDKGSFSKTCTLTLKVTNRVWQSDVAAGDWVVVWLSNTQAQQDQIVSILSNTQPANYGNQLCNWNSGLKFIGRVLSTSLSDATGASGIRTLSQSISCQAFLEFATSVYYTYVGAFAVDAAAGNASGEGTPEGKKQQQIHQQQILRSRLTRTLSNASDKFLKLYNSGEPLTPDTLMMYLFALIMGLPKDGAVAAETQAGDVGDAIQVPAVIAGILNRPTAKYLWELYNLYTGIQHYTSTDPEPYRQFMPDFDPAVLGTDKNGNPNQKYHIFWKAKDERCKGLAPFFPPMWNNETMWDILQQYLHPTLNEMYTALRCNYDNTIGPTLIIREKPFSTGLRNLFVNTKTLPAKIATGLYHDPQNVGQTLSAAVQQGSTTTTRPDSPATQKVVQVALTAPSTDPNSNVHVRIDTSHTPLTYYYNLPRWELDKSMVRSATLSCQESQRINFVQVWGQNGSAQYVGFQIPPETWRWQQIQSGNAVSDDLDIQRNGLRALISESQFDFFHPPAKFESQTPLWATMLADWNFNGHLKLSGTIECNGIMEPICEGDNLLYDGMLYHIESVAHNTTLSGNGHRIFTTTLTVSRGIRAQGLVDKNSIPTYYCHNKGDRAGYDFPSVSIFTSTPGLPGNDEG